MKVPKKIRAKHNLEPRISLFVVRCDKNAVPGASAVALSKLAPFALASSVVVPVNQRNPAAKLHQEVDDSWKRYVSIRKDKIPPSFANPVIVSPRGRWFMDDDTIEIYDRAVLIDGASRLEVALQLMSPHEIPVVIVMGLDAERELSLRRQIHDSPFKSDTKIVERIGTTSPRLVVHDVVITFEIVSDPFVVPTIRGYSPAVLVQRSKTPHLEHLLISAKSLATEFERLRTKYGSLIGLHVRTRKINRAQTSPYEVQLVKPRKGQNQ